MSKPIITLTAIAFPAGIVDLTAATSSGGVYTPMQGDEGSDWSFQQKNYLGSLFTRIKTQGNGRATWVQFVNGADPTLTYANGTTTAAMAWTTADEIQATASGASDSQASIFNTATNQINCGVNCAPPADQSTRVITSWGNVGAGFTVRASLSDGSFPDQTLALTSGNYAFQVTYCALTVSAKATPSSVLNLEIRRVTGTGTSYIAPQVNILAIPTRAPRPTFFSKYLRATGAFGGAHA